MAVQLATGFVWVLTGWVVLGLAVGVPVDHEGFIALRIDPMDIRRVGAGE